MHSTSRRRMIQQLTASVAATAFPIFGQNPPPESHHSPQPVTKQAAEAYRYLYFRPEQLGTLEALTETIIPADEHSPGAKEARVAEYIDTMVADAPESVKRQWDIGLVLINNMAQNSFGKPYGECSELEQIAVLSEFAGDEDGRDTPEEKFFLLLKRATVDGYYTSKIGIYQDLQYQGNVALPEFPGCGEKGLL
ncbi:MAG: gluconate 2-dehydrogenase subunit 3 family protein [Acidobacteriaceae bacterium]|nr:gluconate 2-dehydrogenase subunit 3 family protein [Acidobacteriaceae bacterium]